jgi:hypothetical protein
MANEKKIMENVILNQINIVENMTAAVLTRKQM